MSSGPISWASSGMMRTSTRRAVLPRKSAFPESLASKSIGRSARTFPGTGICMGRTSMGRSVGFDGVTSAGAARASTRGLMAVAGAAQRVSPSRPILSVMVAVFVEKTAFFGGARNISKVGKGGWNWFAPRASISAWRVNVRALPVGGFANRSRMGRRVRAASWSGGVAPGICVWAGMAKTKAASAARVRIIRMRWGFTSLPFGMIESVQ